MDDKTIKRVDNMAKVNVTTDTTRACVSIPEGIPHITLLLDSASSSFMVNKQLWECDFSSVPQRMKNSGAPNSTLE